MSAFLKRATAVVGASLLAACAGDQMASGANEAALTPTSAVAPTVQAFFDGCVDTAPDFAGASSAFAAAGIPMGDSGALRHPTSALLRGPGCAVALTGDHDAQVETEVATLLASRPDKIGRTMTEPGGALGYAAEYFVGDDTFIATVSENLVIAGQRATIMTIYPKPN